MSVQKSIFNRDIIVRAMILMDESQCVGISCSDCALSIDGNCIQSTLQNHLRDLDIEKRSDE